MNIDGFSPIIFSSNQSINLLTNPIILSSNEYLDDLVFNDMKSKLYFKRIPLKLCINLWWNAQLANIESKCHFFFRIIESKVWFVFQSSIPFSSTIKLANKSETRYELWTNIVLQWHKKITTPLKWWLPLNEKSSYKDVTMIFIWWNILL